MNFSGKNEGFIREVAREATLGIRVAMVALSLLAFHAVAVGQQSATESQVKAAYLLNFAKLGEWPRFALPDGASALVIGVSGGDEEFVNVLRATVAGKLAGTHMLVVRAVSSDAEMKLCHMIFFRAAQRRRGQAAIEGMARVGVLSVGEDESFLREGGMINLVMEHGNVRFEVNADALDHSEIHFSAKILALAKSGFEAAHATAANSPGSGTRQVERNVIPEYPEIAARMNLKGMAQVEARVRPDGTVKEVRVLGGHPVLAEALARAVRLWKYQPASKETLEVVKYSFDPQ
ncbi:MAG: TonB family protein [Candidatus Sulfotelmatobacter sp.]